MVIGFVGMDLAGPPAPPLGRHQDRRDVVQHGLEHGGVVGVGSADKQRQRQPAAVAGQVQLGPSLAAIDRIGAD
jgi:hypothetical protein